MTVADGAILRCSARWTSMNGQDQVNVWWYRCDFAAGQDDQTVFDHVNSDLELVFLAWDQLMGASWAPRDLKVDVVQHIDGAWKTVQNVGFGSWGATLNTAEAGNALPEGVAALGFLYTGLGKHQGRRFLGGFTEAHSDAGGNADSTLTAAIVAGLTELLTPHVISAGNELVAVVADMAAGIVREIVEVASSAGFGYQRRRRPGRGS